jgi:hypothetical protein
MNSAAPRRVVRQHELKSSKRLGGKFAAPEFEYLT